MSAATEPKSLRSDNENQSDSLSYGVTSHSMSQKPDQRVENYRSRGQATTPLMDGDASPSKGVLPPIESMRGPASRGQRGSGYVV